MEPRPNRHNAAHALHRVTLELSYKLRIEGNKCQITLPDNANLLDIHAILQAFGQSTDITVRKILLIKHENHIKIINNITEYVKTNSFMELEHLIRKKISSDREEDSHILHEHTLSRTELQIECLETINKVPQIKNRRETAQTIIENFKKKWDA